jgi:hypothetical protein
MRFASLRALAVPSLGVLALVGCADHGSGILGNLTPFRSVGFESREVIETGNPFTAAVEFVDVDGDGRLDIAAVGLEGTLAVRLARGGINFAPAILHPLPAIPVSLETADLDGDGDADLLVVMVDGTAQVWRGDGTGNFTADAAFNIGFDPLDCALGDLDADGAADLLVCERGRDDLAMFRGMGDGTFVGRISLRPTARGGHIGYPRIGDFDGDGRADLALADFEGGRVTILLGDASGLPQTDASVDVGAGPFGLAAGDLDGDGLTELAVSVYGENRVKVLDLVGPGLFAISYERHVDGSPCGALIDDFDGDGRSDLATVIAERHAMAIFANRGAGLAEESSGFALGGSPLTPIFADLDTDGRKDLIVPAFGADGVNLFRGRDGGLRGSRLFATEGIAAPTVVHAADFDGDGATEVVVASIVSDSVQVAIARPDGSGELKLRALASLVLGRAVQNLSVADVDDDGRPDLLATVTGGLKILANRSSAGALRFDTIPAAASDVLAAGDGPFEVVCGDLDADRKKDLLLTYLGENRVAFLRGSDKPFDFQAPISVALSGRPFGLALGDFDADGELEAAASRLDVATVSLLEWNGSALVVSADLPVGPGPNYLRAADFNADGRADLVVSDGARDTVTVLRSLGGNAFDVGTLATGSAPTALLATDLNGDGFDDILVASLRGSDARVILGDGRGGFAAPITLPGVHLAISAALADLDGDGLRDLLLGSLEARAIASFRNISARN